MRAGERTAVQSALARTMAIRDHRSGRAVMNLFNLDSYLSRIGYTGARTATLDTLRALHQLHPAAIAFENLDPLMGKPVRIDVPAIAEKMITNGRGGYCFEQNTLIQAALTALGFSVTSHAGRVLWRLRPGAKPARTHMVLCIVLPDGDYIADVGFGRLTLTAPLRLVHDVEQETPHGLYRLIRAGDEYQLQAKLDGEWEPIYQFHLQEQSPADWDVANWWTATHPGSIFTRGLMAARPAGDRVYALYNGDMNIYHRDGRVERRALAGADELAAVLRNEFAIRLPEGCEPVLAQLFEPAH
jgi:N-hydroxyarylamine O-acetyltransferase